MLREIVKDRPPKPAPLIPRGKVLLVDEDLTDLHYYAGMLEERGYEIQTAATYAEGARLLEHEFLDFIVLGQGSSAFEGRPLLERALEIDRRIPVLVIAGSLDMGCYLDAMQLGAVDYLEKPVTASEIARVLETHLRPRMVAA